MVPRKVAPGLTGLRQPNVRSIVFDPLKSALSALPSIELQNSPKHRIVHSVGPS